MIFSLYNYLKHLKDCWAFRWRHHLKPNSVNHLRLLKIHWSLESSDSFGLYDNVQHRMDRAWQNDEQKGTVFTLLWRHCNQQKLVHIVLHIKTGHQLRTVHQLGPCVSTKHRCYKHKVPLSSPLWSPVLRGPGTQSPVECNNVDMQSWFHTVLPLSSVLFGRFPMIGYERWAKTLNQIGLAWLLFRLFLSGAVQLDTIITKLIISLTIWY